MQNHFRQSAAMMQFAAQQHRQAYNNALNAYNNQQAYNALNAYNNLKGGKQNDENIDTNDSEEDSESRTPVQTNSQYEGRGFFPFRGGFPIGSTQIQNGSRSDVQTQSQTIRLDDGTEVTKIQETRNGKKTETEIRVSPEGEKTTYVNGVLQ